MADAEPKQKLGLWTSTSLVIGNMIGAGVFLLPAAMASYGSIGLLGWLFAGIGSFFLAKVFSNLSKLMPDATGGPYAFSQRGLGDFAGFLVSWGYYISNAGGNAAITISFISAMSTFFPILATSKLIASATGFTAVWLLAYINTLGVVTSGKLQLVTTVLKIAPLVLVAFGGLFFIHLSNFHPFNSSGTSVFAAISTTAALTMFSYFGIECASIPAGDVANPEKTIARATMLGLLITAFIYILGSASVMGMIPAKTLEHSLTPYADAAAIIYGPSARYWISAGMAIAAFGCLNGWTLVQGQVPYATAKDKLFPAVFGYVNKRGVPWVGIMGNAALISLFILMNYSKGLVEMFKFLLLFSTLTSLVPFLFSVAAYPIIRAKKKLSHGWTGALVVTFFAFVYTLWAIAGTGQDAVFYGFMFMMTGLPLYMWLVYKRDKDLEKT